ncbi:M13 family metallopeptidase [Phenylobacterium sp.]|jgi:putative endopeptidase|uniref:M13 family metallopeptidase n=1 Tax=Phenylobacterium sp. TaxID=1871053 RepID=UPI002F92F76D
MAAAGRSGWAATPAGKPEYGEFGLDLSAVDRSIAPGDDFYRYVNNGWLKANTIPPDRASYGGPLRERNEQRTRDVIQSAGTLGTANGRKIADYYQAWIDEAALEGRGIEPLKPELARVAAVTTPAALARALALLSWGDLPNPNGAGRPDPTPIAATVMVDVKQPTRYVPALSQGGLSLPDRDYYIVDTPANVAARNAYRAHIAKMFALAGFDDVEARAARVYGLEDRIARGWWSREETRQAEKRYNPFTRADFAAKAPGLDWDAYIEAAGIAGQPLYIVAQPSSIATSAALARDVPLADWRDYLAFRAIRNFAPAGPRAFRQEDFAFNGGVLQGTPQMPEGWKQAVIQTDRALGHAVGEIYLARYFPASSRAMVTEMTGNLKLAMAQRIRGLSWMTPATKARALKKLANLRVEVGGQTPPRDYSSLEVKPGEAFENLLRAQAFTRRRILNRLGRPVDRREWSMNPQTINAQSNSTLVKVMFPAGYLQPPNFDPHADPAVNYGAVGRVIGHEISHQFDDQGSKYDETGALNNWWAPSDLERFRAAGAGLAAQYDAYEPLPGLRINGRLTLGENIGDLAGLAMSLDAYHASLKGKPAPVLGGLTGDQRFFMSFAQTHRSLQRENALRQQLISDPHSPNEWRSAEVRNMDAWYREFDVKPGQKMYLPPEQRVRVW